MSIFPTVILSAPTGRRSQSWRPRALWGSFVGKVQMATPNYRAPAVRLLRAPSEQAVVLEGAISRFWTGLVRGFGLLIGVPRGEKPELLRQSGDDVVVRDLAEIDLARGKQPMARHPNGFPDVHVLRAIEWLREGSS